MVNREFQQDGLITTKKILGDMPVLLTLAVTKFTWRTKYLMIFEGGRFVYEDTQKLPISQTRFIDAGLLRGLPLKIEPIIRGEPVKRPNPLAKPLSHISAHFPSHNIY